MSWQTGYLRWAFDFSAYFGIYGVSLVAVWLLGPQLGYGPIGTIVIIALILITLPFALLFTYLRRRHKRQTEAAEEAQGGGAPAAQPAGKAGKSQGKPGIAPVTGTYEELRRGTEEAVSWLRGTNLAGAKSAADAVYALPWFVIAGPAGSGKSSLALASGLNFQPLPSQRPTELRVIRPTAHCDWRVTDSAIFLDTSGRYQTEGPERDEWGALIETVKQYRKARPLDGYVLTVNAASLLQLSETELEQQAKILRGRLDEAMMRSGTRFPVYLVFTHADALEGFAEFFRNFNREEHDQVWGVTFPLAQSANAHALFDSEFDHLYGRLLRRRLVQLGFPAPPDKLLRIFKYPGRFRRTRNRLGYFTSALFRPNPFSQSPLLRGFYFTSNVGAGTPDARQLVPGADYFAPVFFRDVLLRDKDIVGSTQAARKNPAIRRYLLAALGAMFVFIFFLMMLVSFIANKALIAEVLDRSNDVAEIRKATSKTPNDPAGAQRELAAVEKLRESLSKLDDYENHSPPFYMRFGLYTGNKLNTERSVPRNLYFEAVKDRFLGPTVAKMQDDLKAFVTGQGSVSPAGGSSAGAPRSNEDILGRNYDLLKAYLMLVNPDKVEPTFLANQLQGYWKQSAPPGMQGDALLQLEYYASQVKYPDAPHPEIDNNLVAQARQKLIAYPVVNRVYKRITGDINASLKTPVSLDSIPGARENNVLTGTYSVPAAFTLDGQKQMEQKLVSSAAAEFRRDDWVMQGSGVQGQTTDVRTDELRSLYYRDYVDNWQRFLAGIKVKDYNSKEDAIAALRTLSGGNSPLQSVIREVARQTNFTAASSGILGWISSLFGGSAPAGGPAADVEREFSPLSQFVTADKSDKSKPTPVATYLTTLKSVADKLNTRKEIKEISQALQNGQDILGLESAQKSISDSLEGQGFKSSPASDTAAALLKQPLNNLEALLVGANLDQIEKTWAKLYQSAQDIERGYPFTDTTTETPIEKVSAYLNPVNGQFTQFVKVQLKTYFNPEDWTPKPEAADKFSPAFIEYVKNAFQLQKALFPKGDSRDPGVTYQIKLTPPADNTVVTISVDGNPPLTNQNAQAAYNWPGNKSGAKIEVATVPPTEPKLFSRGQWGVLQMFDEGGGTNGKEGNPSNLKWQVGTTVVNATVQPTSGSVFQRELFRALHAPQGLRK